MKQFYTLLLCLLGTGMLVAQTPNTFYGLNFTTGQLQLAQVDASNGAVTLLGSGPISPDLFQSGVSDMDAQGGRYFYVRDKRIYTVDIQTGVVLSSPQVTTPSGNLGTSQYLTNIAYDWLDSTLYGLYVDGTLMQLASVNLQTGALTLLTQTPIAYGGYQSGVSDIDPFLGRYFFTANNRIYSLDLDNGAIISNPVMSNPNSAISAITNIAYNWITGKIYGVNFAPGPNPPFGPSLLRLAEVDPQTGTVVIINETPVSNDQFSHGVADLNPINNTYSYTRGVASSSQIITVNLATGQLVNSPLLQNPNGAVQAITNIACPFKVDVAPVPQADFETNSDGLQISLRDVSPYAASWEWDFGDGHTHTAQHPQHTFTAPGTYNVRLIATNVSGQDTFYQTVTVEDAITSAESAPASDWKLYPNPSQGSFVIETPETLDPSGPSQLSLFNLNGEKVWESPEGLQIGKNKFDLPAMASGTYLIRVTSPASSWSRRLIIAD